jgi:hypothetical protein
VALIYSNENVPFPTVQALRAHGHDVLTSFDAGNANQGIEDHEALRFARQQGRAIVTNDRYDFRALHKSGQVHTGIVEFTNDANFQRLADHIHAALQDPLATGRFYASVTRGGYTFR